MPRPNLRAGALLALASIDLAAAAAAPHLASLIDGPPPSLATGLASTLSYALITGASLLLTGLYRVRPTRDPKSCLADLLKTLIAAHAIILLRFALLRTTPATPPLAASIGWAATTFALSATLIITCRLLAALRWRTSTAAPRTATALVMAGPCDRPLRDRLDRLAGPSLFYLFAWNQNANTPPCGLRTITDAATFTALIRAGTIDDIVVFTSRTDDAAARSKIDTLVAALADQPIRIRLAFDAVAEIGADSVASGQSLHMVTVLDRPIHPLSAATKRTLDLLGAALLLTLLAIPMALIAILIRPTGPILFRQRRTGLDGSIFTVLKFRTMHPANHRTTPQAQRNDTRITPLGRILRRLSLDELPQLFNVLRGDMSLVGPRPHAPHTNAGAFTFETATAFYGVRHRVKPGLTGLAQVRGLRGPTECPELVAARVAADLDYIQHWSPWLDLAILLRTIPAVLVGRNAC